MGGGGKILDVVSFKFVFNESTVLASASGAIVNVEKSYE